MTEQQKDIISVNGEEYDVGAMTDQQKYLVSQLRDLNTKIAQAQFGIDQLRGAQDAFTNALISSTQSQAEDEASDAA